MFPQHVAAYVNLLYSTLVKYYCHHRHHFFFITSSERVLFTKFTFRFVQKIERREKSPVVVLTAAHTHSIHANA